MVLVVSIERGRENFSPHFWLVNICLCKLELEVVGSRCGNSRDMETTKFGASILFLLVALLARTVNFLILLFADTSDVWEIWRDCKSGARNTTFMFSIVLFYT